MVGRWCANSGMKCDNCTIGMSKRPGCCGNLMSAPLHGYGAKVRVFSGLSKKTEENLSNEWGHCITNEGGSVLSGNSFEEEAVLKRVKLPVCERRRDSYIHEGECGLTSSTIDHEAQ